jgi:predicted metal-dependent hydrolase
MTPPATITVDGVTLSLVVEHKAVKHINARLRDTTLYVSAPQKIDQKTLEQAVADLARRLLRRVHARTINAEEDALALVREVAARFPKPPMVAQVQFVTTQEARWGSYSPATGTIRLNAVLRRMPRWVLEAVVAHELAHVPHPDHSPAFWALLRRVCPDTDKANAFLHGVAWLSQQWDDLPPVERAILQRGRGEHGGEP